MTETPWTHAAPLPGLGAAWRPVYTLRCVEWLLTVPMLLLLTGCCALGRPLAEAVRPIAITNAYITASWVALFAKQTAVRVGLLVCTFGGYGLASCDMLRWVSAFLHTAPPDMPCRWLRISSVLLLIAVFGLYGVVYLLALAGVIDVHQELLLYTCFGFATKVVVSLIFTAIRTMEYHQALTGLLCRVRGISSAFVSLLRGSFDLVIPCLAHLDGTCLLPCGHSGDSADFEHCLGYKVLGRSLNELLAGPMERARFAAYVQNSLRHSESSRHCGRATWSALSELLGFGQGTVPPVAQVLHIKLRRTEAASDAPGDYISAVVHLSAVPGARSGAHGVHQMIAGLCLAMHETAAVLTPESSAAGISNPSPTAFANAPAQALSSTSARSVIGPCPSLPSEANSAPVGPPAADLAEQETAAHSMELPPARQARCARVRRRAHAAKMQVGLLTRRMGKSRAMASRRHPGTSRASGGGGQRRRGKGGGRCDSGGSDSEAVASPLGGSDVCSQSSKLSHIGSVTMACRQLLGPLHDHLPPVQLVSKRMEDHMQCAAEMVRLRAPAKIAKLHHEQQLAQWRSSAQSHLVARMLQRGQPPEIDEAVWRQHLLPHLQGPPPGRRPAGPEPPDDAELWARAWRRTYDSDASTSD